MERVRILEWCVIVLSCFLNKEHCHDGYFLIDLDFWYGVGPGNPTSAAQGIGYVQELVARLTKTPITAASTTLNSTIVGNPSLFPLDQPIFVDATHDVVISNSEYKCPSLREADLMTDLLCVSSRCRDELHESCRQWTSSNRPHPTRSGKQCNKTTRLTRPEKNHV